MMHHQPDLYLERDETDGMRSWDHYHTSFSGAFLPVAVACRLGWVFARMRRVPLTHVNLGAFNPFCHVDTRRVPLNHVNSCSDLCV